MAARSTQVLLDRLLAFLPPQYETAEALLAGLAAAMNEAEEGVFNLESVLPFGFYVASLPGGNTTLILSGAEGIWLDLHAIGYGLLRSPGEDDTTLRARLRNVDDRATRPAILDAVDAILSQFGEFATMIEWWEEPFLDVEETVAPGGLYLDSTFLSGGPNSFLLLVPEVGLGYAVSPDPHLDLDAYLDSLFLGVDVQDPVYSAIVAEVERLRAAGIRWRLVIGDPPP